MRNKMLLCALGGLMFGIRLRHIAVRELLQNAVASDRLKSAIETMPDEMLRYKGLSAIRDQLVQWLAARS